MLVVSAVDDAEIFCFDEISSNTQIGIKVLLGRKCARGNQETGIEGDR